ncbi:MAG: fbpA 2 [Deltaproteobacteria bacterium]|nr:fbpA 2 [Deltaproteobacteria bacterium]
MTKSMIGPRIGLFSLLLMIGSIALGHAATNDTLIDAAKREGEVVYYASMNLSEANTIVAEFEKRYPFIKVKLQRTGSEKLLNRVLTEFRAKKIFADVIQTVEFSMHIFNRSGALARYLKEEGFWTTVYYNAYVTAYNTRMVPARQLPKSYDDLLDPKWKGKLMMEGTKADWFAGMLQILGQERGLKYMRELAKQQPSTREGHELLAQLESAARRSIGPRSARRRRSWSVPASPPARRTPMGPSCSWSLCYRVKVRN